MLKHISKTEKRKSFSHLSQNVRMIAKLFIEISIKLFNKNRKKEIVQSSFPECAHDSKTFHRNFNKVIGKMQGPIFPTIISQANVDSINDNSINSLTSVQLSIITITTITTTSLQKTK